MVSRGSSDGIPRRRLACLVAAILPTVLWARGPAKKHRCRQGDIAGDAVARLQAPFRAGDVRERLGGHSFLRSRGAAQEATRAGRGSDDRTLHLAAARASGPPRDGIARVPVVPRWSAPRAPRLQSTGDGARGNAGAGATSSRASRLLLRCSDGHETFAAGGDRVAASGRRLAVQRSVVRRPAIVLSDRRARAFVAAA